MRRSAPPAGRARGGVPAARPRGPRRPLASQPDELASGKKILWHTDANRGVRLERHADVSHPDLSGDPRSIAGEQARLGKSERDRRSRLHTWSVGDTGVGVEAGWHVDRDHRQAGRVDAFDPFGELALWLTAETRAKNRVDDCLSTIEPQLGRDLDPDPLQRVQLPGRG